VAGAGAGAGAVGCGAAFGLGVGRAGAVALGRFSVVFGVGVAVRSAAISNQPPMAISAATRSSGI